jgi:hypothetical protein
MERSSVTMAVNPLTITRVGVISTAAVERKLEDKFLVFREYAVNDAAPYFLVWGIWNTDVHMYQWVRGCGVQGLLTIGRNNVCDLVLPAEATASRLQGIFWVRPEQPGKKPDLLYINPGSAKATYLASDNFREDGDRHIINSNLERHIEANLRSEEGRKKLAAVIADRESKRTRSSDQYRPPVKEGDGKEFIDLLLGIDPKQAWTNISKSNVESILFGKFDDVGHDATEKMQTWRYAINVFPNRSAYEHFKKSLKIGNI